MADTNMAEVDHDAIVLFPSNEARAGKERLKSASEIIVVNYDKALEYLGGFGPWQKRVFFPVAIPIAISALQVMGIVFLAFEPDFKCRVSLEAFSGLNATPAELLNVTIPWELEDEEWKRSQCERYTYNLSVADFNTTYAEFVEAHPAANRTQIPCDQGYEHDTSEYKSTVVTDWDLVCGNSWKVNLAESLWMAGLMFGAVVGGHAADRWGRKPVLLIALAADCVFCTASAFSPNYIAFAAYRFLMGTFTMVTTLVPFVIGTELVSADKRGLVGMVIWIYWAVAYVLLAGIAYLIRPWMWLQIAMTVPFLVCISFWWIIPESPRWLISRNRHEEAAAILRQAEKVAKVTIPDDVFHDAIPLSQEQEQAKKSETYTFIDLVRTPNLRKWSLNLFFNWAVNSLVYYGISLNTSALSGNVYLNFAMSGLVEIPAYLGSIYLLNKFGRRWPLCILLVFGGISCIVAFFIPKSLGWLTTTLAMIGKFCITATFGIVYVFSAEIFPTVVRQIGIGMASMSARVGGIVAPFVNLLETYWAPMPYVIFGGASIAAGLLALLLPETNKMKLPSTIEEGENFGKEGIIQAETGERTAKQPKAGKGVYV
ncbi:PREDICTED: organic cation transporter protein-like [Branchiostoma belcheri]|uniref:Organic cation transporter protein-like n=1 Tax=Branchiostoma belcheri TaxID=7741 RepID=A0A6P4YZ97_BRABE|nr:PREDICTED: organic cation transporter protein-like [Branchiostoma belcheri]